MTTWKNWDDVGLWKTGGDGNSVIKIGTVFAPNQKGIEIDYNLGGGGWVQMIKNVKGELAQDAPVVFKMKIDKAVTVEVKYVDVDGSNFVKRINTKDKYKDWKDVVVYFDNLEYGWGGDENYDGIKELCLAVSGSGHGKIFIDEIGAGKPGMKTEFTKSGPQIDPESRKEGLGFSQRRDDKLNPEDPLVIKWIEQMQDLGSDDKQLVPSDENNAGHTFNNSLCAIAFMVKGNRLRAERILDFYANATKQDNDDLSFQSFYYKGEARGFYQSVVLDNGVVSVYHDANSTDRWIGDMAWLLIAYKQYEHIYRSNKYEKIAELLKDLLVSFYKEESPGGYIQHGWRRGDSKLHEGHGHPEGNIDCYVALRMCGESEYADNIKKWLDSKLGTKNLPLDLYTWRVLAYGKESARLLDIPEYDLRYRKILEVKGEKVMGLYDHADINVNNIWLDGVGHIACAYFFVGNEKRGNFYSNQLDKFLIERNINGEHTRSLPYTANKEGGYEWIAMDRGTLSVACWYIFSKNRFNPLSFDNK